MEQEGLKSIMNHMKDRSIKVSVIITGGHRSVQKWLRKNCNEHYFEVWHVSKGENCML